VAYAPASGARRPVSNAPGALPAAQSARCPVGPAPATVPAAYLPV